MANRRGTEKDYCVVKTETLDAPRGGRIVTVPPLREPIRHSVGSAYDTDIMGALFIDCVCELIL